MTPSERLQAAKEAVAEQTVFKQWQNIVDELAGTRDYEEYLERATILALTNQAEEFEKEKQRMVNQFNDFVYYKT